MGVKTFSDLMSHSSPETVLVIYKDGAAVVTDELSIKRMHKALRTSTLHWFQRDGRTYVSFKGLSSTDKLKSGLMCIAEDYEDVTLRSFLYDERFASLLKHSWIDGRYLAVYYCVPQVSAIGAKK